MLSKLKISFSILIGICSTSLAIALEAPDYNEVFAQQLKCNKNYFTNKIWDKKLKLLEVMDSHTIVLISNAVITELPKKVYKNVHPDYKNRKERSFKVTATSFGYFTCDERKIIELNQPKGITVETFIDISETKTGSGTFNISQGKPDEEGSFLYDSSEDGGGMFCVVLVNDFIKNPQAINVEKLCEGQSARNLEITKKSIEQVRQGLKETNLNIAK